MAKELVISTGRHETRVAIMEDDQLVEIYFQRANEYSLAGSIHKGRVTRVLPGMQSAFVDLGLERDTFLYVSDFFEENEEFEKMPDSRERSERGGRGRDGGGRDAAARDGAPRDIAPRDGAAPRDAVQRDSVQRDSGRDGGRDRDGGRGRGRDRDRRDARPPIQSTAVGVDGEGAGATTEVPAALGADTGTTEASEEARRGNRRRRGRGNQGGNFPDSKYAEASGEGEERTAPVEIVEPMAAMVSAPEPDKGFDEESSAPPIILPGETLLKYRGRAPEMIAAVVQEDAEGDFEELDNIADELAHATVSTVHSATPETLAAQREEAELAEVKEHLAEMAKENEEQRDFEEAERLAYAEKEGAAPVDEQDGEAHSEIPEGAIELADRGDETVDGNDLPPMVQSAELRQSDQRFLQQRTPEEGGEGGENGGRRRRRSRGRDRMASAAGTGSSGEAATDDSTVIRQDTDGEQMQALTEEPLEGETRRQDARPEETRRDETRRDDGRREGRGRGGRGERGGDRSSGDRSAGDRSSSAERGGDRNDRPDRERRPQPSITELLKEGQEILVQIAKEPLGQKGARITSHIALPGRYCVYMPTVDHTGVSRKIASDEERMRLKRILQGRKEGMPGGFIIRTAGEGRTEEEIHADINFLHNLWIDIKHKAESKPAPALIYHDLEIVERVMRDQLGPEFKSIWVDNETIYENILRFLERFQPAMVSRVKMYTRQASIFDNFGITQELEKALRPKVWLKSGGYIVINQTEALVAIDINTGKFVGKSNRLEDTIVKTNVEAIREIVRQVRLRDLGGIIVIDFIDMDERKNRMRVMQALEEAMRADRAPYKILQFNDFGLVAITRKRVKQSLERTLCAPCPYCEGSAYVKSVQTVVGEILNEAKKLARALEDAKDVMLRVNPEVAKVLKSADNQYLEELEEILGRPVMVVSDGLIHQEKFDLA